MNKLAVISGGSKGIGLATVKRFGKAGYQVATCARDAQTFDRITKEYTDQYNTPIYSTEADLGTRAGIDKFVSWVEDLAMPVDVLINNVGRYAPSNLLDEPEGFLEDMLQVNLYTAYHITRQLAKGMIERKQGHIINICSVAGRMAYPKGGSYSIAKFALSGFTKVLREDLKNHGLRVTGIYPGATQTSSWEGEEFPEGRLMKPDDVAEIIFSTHVLSQHSVVEEVVLRPQLGDL